MGLAMTDRIAFTYGNFYDVPRQIEIEFRGAWYFLRSYFETENDDYTSFYEVYLLPFRSQEEVKANSSYWMNLDSAVNLGRISIAEIGLDETRRQSIDGAAFGNWLSSHRQSRHLK